MKKWAIAAILYLAAVIGGFQAYDKWMADDKGPKAMAEGESGEMVMGSSNTGKEKTDEMDMDGGHNGEGETEGAHDHMGSSAHLDVSEVNTFFQNDGQNIKIFLKDKAGNPVDDLEVNHEKILHLIMVDDQLQKYYHVHPEKTGKGEFTIGNNLPAGFYKAFIDIKPKDMAYVVEPVPFIVGNPNQESHGHSLVPDTDFTKSVEGETVKLRITSVKAGEASTLSFDLDKTNLTPYLGAMGHVVILDEYGKKFLHVHPTNDKDTTFETEFSKPGVYKIWAEFKQNGMVRAFPFVVKIKK